MNTLIIEKLAEVAAEYRKNKEKSSEFKANAIMTAITNIRAYGSEIKSGADARKNIAGIGPSIAAKIDDILSKKDIHASNQMNEAKADPCADLLRITGMGETRAKLLIKDGITTIQGLKEAIKENKVSLTHHILIGLKYLDDFETRIPRTEIADIERYLISNFAFINPHCISNICGSYRRGKLDCGDIDILITETPGKQKPNLLKEIIGHLSSQGFLIDHLTKNGDKKYMGVCRMNGYTRARRIDIRYIDYSSYYTALQYFTGSKEFNLSLRRHALNCGYSLSEYALTKTDGTDSPQIHSEQDIFTILNIPYVPPTQREEAMNIPTQK